MKWWWCRYCPALSSNNLEGGGKLQRILALHYPFPAHSEYATTCLFFQKIEPTALSPFLDGLLHQFTYVYMFTEETIILSKFTCELPSSPCLLISFLSVQKGLRTQILQPGHSSTTEKKRMRRVSNALNIKTTLCPRFSSKTDFMQVRE